MKHPSCVLPLRDPSLIPRNLDHSSNKNDNLWNNTVRITRLFIKLHPLCQRTDPVQPWQTAAMEGDDPDKFHQPPIQPQRLPTKNRNQCRILPHKLRHCYPFLLFLSLLWHPISLIVFTVMMALWLFLYFLRDQPVKALGYEVDNRIVMTALLVLTVAMLFLTDVTDNIIVGLSIGIVVVLVHGLLRSTDDLFFVDDEEGIGSPALFHRDDAPLPLPLKHPASSSFSMS